MPGGWEWLIIIGVLLLLFGAKRLPEMARSVGQSARVFKGEMKGMRDDDKRTPDQQPATPPAAAPSAPPAAPAPPVALPPADGQVNGATAQPSEPARRDPVRPDTDR